MSGLPRRRPASSDGSQHSSNSEAFGSRPNSMRRRNQGYRATSAILPSDMRFQRDDSIPISQPLGSWRGQLWSCCTCKRSQSSPYISFCLPLDTRDLLTSPAQTATPCGDLDNDLHELLKAVNALLNDCGGTVCVHCSLSCPVALLDKLVDRRLRELVSNATAYDDNFERLVLDEQHVVYRVKPTPDPAVSTLSFPSLLTDNQGLVPPTQQQIHTLVLTSLQPSPSSEAGGGYRRFYEGRLEFVYGQPVGIHPSCKVYLHRLHSEAVDRKRGQSYGEKVVSYWWEELGLPKFVAALCKQQSGGSVFLGVDEEKSEPKKLWKSAQDCDLNTLFPGSCKKIWVDVNEGERSSQVRHIAREDDVPSTERHPTGRYLCQGVQLTPREQQVLEATILQRIRSDMLWYPQYPSKDPLSVIFHPVRAGPSHLFVVEVVMSKYNGVAFHDKTGPEAYGIRPVRQGHEIRRLSAEEFMEQVSRFAVRVRPVSGDSQA